MKLHYLLLPMLGLLTLAASLRADESAKLQVGSRPPPILTQDIAGNPVRIPNTPSGFVLLTFFRGTGCPICRVRFHELETHADELKARHVDSIAIFEDKEDFLRQYTQNTPSFTRLVADPDGIWYRSYRLDHSLWGVMKTMFNDGMKKAAEGKALLASAHGSAGGTRLPAEFLIDETGNLIAVHYSSFVGDHLPIDTILQYTAAKAQ